MEQVEEACICPICNEVYDEGEHYPRVLPCGHTLCTDCISQMIAQDAVTCPVCKVVAAVPAGAECMTKNFAAMDLVQASINALCRTTSGEDAMTRICQIHALEFRYYDRQCEQMICPDCSAFVHNGHPCCLIKQHIDEIKKDVYDLVDKTSKKCDKLKKAISSYDKLIADMHKKRNEAFTSLHDAFDKIHVAVASEKATLEEQLQTIFQQQMLYLNQERRVNAETDSRISQSIGDAMSVTDKPKEHIQNDVTHHQKLMMALEALRAERVHVKKPPKRNDEISLLGCCSAEVVSVVKKFTELQITRRLQWDAESVQGGNVISPFKAVLNKSRSLIMSLPIDASHCVKFQMCLSVQSDHNNVGWYVDVMPMRDGDREDRYPLFEKESLLCLNGYGKNGTPLQINGMLNFRDSVFSLNDKQAPLAEGPLRPVCIAVSVPGSNSVASFSCTVEFQ